MNYSDIIKSRKVNLLLFIILIQSNNINKKSSNFLLLFSTSEVIDWTYVLWKITKDYHLYPQFWQHILFPILLLANPNNPVDSQRLVPDIFLMFVDPQVGHLGLLLDEVTLFCCWTWFLNCAIFNWNSIGLSCLSLIIESNNDTSQVIFSNIEYSSTVRTVSTNPLQQVTHLVLLILLASISKPEVYIHVFLLFLWQ